MSPAARLVLLGLAWGGVAQAEEPDEDDDSQIEVVGDARVPPRKDGAEMALDVDFASQIAGIAGDPIKAVDTIGGVARAAPGTQGVSIWGADARESRLYIDDVPVPRLFHLGGARSILPAAAVQTLAVVPAGPRARYGRGLGGVVAVTTREPDEGRIGAVLSADPIDVGAQVHARTRRGWVAVSARQSVLKQTLNGVAPNRDQALVPIPTYADVQLRSSHRTDRGDTLTLSIIGSDDRLVRGIASVQPDAAFSEDVRLSFGRVRMGLDRPHDGGSTRLVLWGGVDQDRQTLDYGEIRASDQRTRHTGGLLMVREQSISRAVRVRAGIDAEVGQSAHQRSGALALPSREGDIQVFGQPPGDRVNTDRWKVGQAGIAGFMTAATQPHPAVKLTPGIRVEPTLINGDRVLPVRATEPAVGTTQLHIGIQPRLLASWTPIPRLQLYGVGARVQQPPQSGDLSPVFGNPTLAPATSWHGVIGVRARPVGWLEGEVAAFLLEHRNLAVRDNDPTPPVAALLTSAGQGHSRGVQATLTGSRHGISGRVAYTWLRALRRGPREGDTPRPFDREQPHSLQASVVGEHPSGWSLGSRLEVASGAPRTPVTGAVFDARGQRFDPVFGPQNSDRLPVFLALSARAALTLYPRRSQLKLWLDVQNVTNRKNVEELYYNADYSQRSAILGLPILAVMGVEASL